jgi:hypothetical protein
MTHKAISRPSRPLGRVHCLLAILNEEWERRLYAERDLSTLEAQQR